MDYFCHYPETGEDKFVNKYRENQRYKFGPKSLGESEAKRKIYSRGSAKRREAKKILRSAKKSDKFSLLGEAKRSEKSEYFFLKKRMFFSNSAKKAKKNASRRSEKSENF